MDRYAVAQLDEIEEVSDGRAPWRPVRHHFGIMAFGVNAWTGREVGDRIINEHAELEDEMFESDFADEELYLVHDGRARFELDGESVDAPAGTFVFVPPRVQRTAFAEEAGTTIVAVGATPGKVYQPSGWEVWRPVHHLYEAGNYAEAADRGKELLAAHLYPTVLFNVACCESLAGRTDDAIEHLRLGIERFGPFRSFAATDSDFDPIRDDPRFRELVGPEST